jgi:adenylate cyclase
VESGALDEARIAVSLDDKDAMAHAVLAHTRLAFGEREAAIAEARTALQLNPNSAFVLGFLGCVLAFGGYHDEALTRLQQARRASPYDPLLWLWTFWSGIAQFYARRFDDAVATFDEVLRLRPGSADALRVGAAALAHLGRLDEARDRLKRAQAQSQRRLGQRAPWMRDEDYALSSEGIRLASAPE